MTAPSAPIDADLSPYSNDVYYVLEDAAIWKTTNLSEAGAATWEQVWDGASDFDGSEFGVLLRIRCAPNQDGLVYAIGWGYDSTATSQMFCLRSENAGVTWSQHWIAEIDDPEDGSIRMVAGCFTAGGNPESEQQLVAYIDNEDGSITLRPSADCEYEAEERCIQWPGNTMSLILELHPPAPSGLGYYPSIEWDISGNWPSQDYDNDGDGYPMVHGWCSTAPLAGIHNINTVYGGGTHASATLDTRYVQDRIAIGWGWAFPGRGLECVRAYPSCSGDWATEGIVSNLVIEGVTYDKEYPTSGFDVARSNSNWLYVGLGDKVMKSEDGGVTWEELIIAHGAHDICVDPQAAGAIYYWDTDGELRLNVAGVDQGSLLSDSPNSQHGRIARDLNSGKLWVIDSSGNLQRRENAEWITQKSGLSTGQALKAYLDGKLICADSSDIYLSTDYGTTWSDKKGGWADYENPAAAHLMGESV